MALTFSVIPEAPEKPKFYTWTEPDGMAARIRGGAWPRVGAPSSLQGNRSNNEAQTLRQGLPFNLGTHQRVPTPQLLDPRHAKRKGMRAATC